MRKVKLSLAVASFATAAFLAVAGILCVRVHPVIGSDIMLVAQFLTLTATILGIDYKVSGHG